MLQPHRLKLLVTATALIFGISLPAAADDAAALQHFELEIRPVLVEKCIECHGPRDPENGLRLDSRAGLLRGGDSGPAIVPGDADASLLIRAIGYHDSTLQMPPRDRLPDEVVQAFRQWVNEGAVDPREETEAGTQDSRFAGSSFDVEQARAHWAFSPVQSTEPPSVERDDWVRDPIDAYILAQLEAEDLTPAAAADRRTLIRRAYMDLIGLPPTPQQVEAFVADESPRAYERVIDELLASPQYGERWGRHWLDVVRYTDSKDSRSLGAPTDVNNAWRYRDWVVQAFNEDLPYDQFIIDQVAGDLVEGEYDRDRRIATAMLALGSWGAGDSDKRKMMTDIVDDQIDTVSRAFMGLTVACARCHDHVYDPIRTDDYYAMAGFFFSSHIVPEPGDPTAGTPMLQVPLLSPQEQAEREQAADRVQQLAQEIEAMERQHRTEQVAGRLDALAAHLAESADDAAEPATADDVVLQRLVRYASDAAGPSLYETGLMAESFEAPAGQSELPGYGNAEGTPWLLANPLDEPRQVASWTLPPRSVAVHPSPDRAVGVAWRSSDSGKVSVHATINDGDPNGGNGVAWAIERDRDGVRRQFASGDYSPGGEGEATAEIDVQPGDAIALVIDPRDRNHGFDTTVIDLVVETLDAEQPQRWRLSELAEALPGTNPHPGVDAGDDAPPRWYFYTVDLNAEPATVPAGSLLARHLESGGAADDLADGLRRLLSDPPAADTPDGRLRAQLTEGGGPVWGGVDVATVIDEPASQKLAQLRAERAGAQQLVDAPVPIIEAIAEGGVPGSEHEGFADAKVHRRGRYDRLGDVAPRGFPIILADADEQPEIADDTSGRLELAKWLASDDHPLTARVMVNRIWQHHFGQGLVTTPDNFGVRGRPPTHPRLLDHLAASFVESGWSVKAMHRRIMLSATYRQSTRGDSRTRAADPENALVGRMARRRLEAEPLRDAMLAASGEIDLTPGGPAVTELTSPRRTLYLRTVRSDRTGFEVLFDAADPTTTISQREESTVAPQALFMMNHPFVLERAAALAERVAEEAGDDIGDRIDRFYRLLYARPPVEAEVAIGRDLVEQAGGGDHAWQMYAQVLLCGNEFIYID